MNRSKKNKAKTSKHETIESSSQPITTNEPSIIKKVTIQPTESVIQNEKSENCVLELI